MAAELGVDRVARLAEDGADGVGEVADARPGPAAAIPAASARSVVSIIATLSAGLALPTRKLIAASAATPPLATARSRVSRSPSASV